MGQTILDIPLFQELLHRTEPKSFGSFYLHWDDGSGFQQDEAAGPVQPQRSSVDTNQLYMETMKVYTVIKNKIRQKVET